MSNNSHFYGNFKEFVEKNKNRIWRYWVYRRDFPVCKEGQFDPDLQFERSGAYCGTIEEVIELPGDFLIGFQRNELGDLFYYKLSEIRLAFVGDEF